MITQVETQKIKLQHKLSCHCGCVEIILDLPNGTVDPQRCDCSICKPKGAVVASANLIKFIL